MLGFQNRASSEMIARNSRNSVNFLMARTTHDLQISKFFKAKTPVRFVVHLQRSVAFTNVAAKSSGL